MSLIAADERTGNLDSASRRRAPALLAGMNDRKIAGRAGLTAVDEA